MWWHRLSSAPYSPAHQAAQCAATLGTPSSGTWNCLTTIAHANNFGVDEFTEEVVNDGLQGAIDLLGSLFWQFDFSEEIPLCPLQFCVLPLL